MGVTPLGGGDAVGGIGGGRGIRPDEADYGRAVHFNATNSGPMLVGCANDGDTGFKKVVGTIGVGPVGGVVGGGSRGGTGCGGRGGRRGGTGVVEN